MDFQEWSQLHTEFTQLVTEMRHHLQWQEQQGWDGVPWDPSEAPYEIQPPEDQRETPTLKGTTIGKLDVHELSDFRIQVQQSQEAPPPPPVVEEPQSPAVALESLQRDEPPFVVLKSLPQEEVQRREEGLRALSQRLEQVLAQQTDRRRNRFLFGQGNVSSRLLWVGESPGGKESISGELTADPEGRLWLEMLRSLGLQPQDVYRTNVVKIRPSSARSPSREDIALQQPYLWEEIQWIQPDIVIAMGLTAAVALLETQEFLRTLRGKWHQRDGIPILATFHPQYLLRNPAEKAQAWKDLRRVLQQLRQNRGDTT